MLETAAARWASGSDLRHLLESLPRLVHLLGFEHYLFAGPSLYVDSSLSSDQRACVQRFYCACPLPDSTRTHELPLLWAEQSLPAPPQCWASLHGCNLRHGWLQPVQRNGSCSSLAILRANGPVSAPELYRKAGIVMWIAERLHREMMLQSATYGVNDGCQH
ncbi:autoinducer binding domain-containing protein [Pseudomonas sp. S75]